MIEDETLKDILSLVMEKPPSLEVISHWSIPMRHLAESWAMNVHLSASDNSIRKKNLVKPKFLKEYE